MYIRDIPYENMAYSQERFTCAPQNIIFNTILPTAQMLVLKYYHDISQNVSYNTGHEQHNSFRKARTKCRELGLAV